MTPQQAAAAVQKMFGTGAYTGDRLAGTGLVRSGSVTESGSPERFRDQKPSNISQEEWDKLIDDLVKQYNGLPASGDTYGGTFAGPSGKQRNEMSRWTLEDVLAAGKRAGTIKETDDPQQEKRDLATELGGEALNVKNDIARRLGLSDEARFEANAQDLADLGDLKGARDVASQKFHDVAGQVRRHADESNAFTRDTVTGLGKDYLALNEQDQASLAKYLSETDPMMQEIMARTSDPADVQRQLDAYKELQGVSDKYKSLSDPTVTAKERYMSELARREFESADLSNRQAVSEQLANRGLRSGGQQIAMQQGMQQQLSQDRLLKELGIQAGAVDRSMKAMEGWQTASNNLGLQSAAIRDANDSQRQFEDEFKAKEAKRRSDLAGERKGASDETTASVGERDQKYADTAMAGERDIYGRNKDADSADWDVGEKDYGMAGDIYNASTGATDRRVQRASAGLTEGTSAGVTGYNLLADKLGLRANQIADEEEHRLAFGN